jgi:ACS family tartrate transporter-like MFS transporter
VGNLGGAFGPWMVGRIRDTTQSYAGGFYFMGVAMALAAVIVLSLGLGKRSSTGS